MSTYVDGTPAPEQGAGMVQRVCAACGASWIGRPVEVDDWCWWCERRTAVQLEHQRDLLLHPPLPDPADVTRQAVLHAWGQRLQRGVAAGLITSAQARRAYAREDTRARTA